MKAYLTIILILIATNVFAENSHEVEAEKLLEITGTKAAMETMTDIMLTQQLQQNPSLAPFEKIMRQFFQKHLSYESLKNDFISMYVEAFTKEELIAINNFYATEAGKKAVKLMPSLMQKGSEIGQRQVQDNIQELQNMIKQEAKRIEAAQ
jgi:uncharacterized protein